MKMGSKQINTPGTFTEKDRKRYKRVKTESGVSKFVSETGNVVYGKKQNTKKGERYTKLKDSQGNIYKK